MSSRPTNTATSARPPTGSSRRPTRALRRTGRTRCSRSAFSHTHHLALKSGNAKSNYYASVDYRSRDGIIRNTGQERTNLKFGFNRSLFNDKMTLSANINDVFTVGHTVSTDEVLFATLVTNPTEPIYGPTAITRSSSIRPTR